MYFKPLIFYSLAWTLIRWKGSDVVADDEPGLPCRIDLLLEMDVNKYSGMFLFFSNKREKLVRSEGGACCRAKGKKAHSGGGT